MYLSQSFLNQYPDNPPIWNTNPYGYIIYLRTYSRWLEEKQRRETWKETVSRVVEYSMSLYQGSSPNDELQIEAQDLFDLIFNLKGFPAGRTLWIGGTEAGNKHAWANFNCAFRVIDSFEAYCEMFLGLMLGVGMGYRVLKEDIQLLPPIYHPVVAHKPYHGKVKTERIETTQVYREDDSIYIIVGDSKEAWVESLRQYFKAIQDSTITSIIFNYDSVRPAGEPLKTFGGRASGHLALRNMFKKIHKVVLTVHEKLTPLQASDISNIIAEAVVVGGVRRSSQICLFDDPELEIAKVDLYTDPMKEDKWYRSQSNNSILFTERPTKERLRDIFKSIERSFEPGFINLSEMRRRRPNANGTNPCSEIILDNYGVCNLTELNLFAFVEDGQINLEKAGDAIRLCTRVSLRQTNVTIELPEWDRVQKRDRLLGVSLTGVYDAFDACNYSREQFIDVLEELNFYANTEAREYAFEMRVPQPLLVCALKPSGTLSQLPTVSSGAHRSFAPYFIRRVRMSSSDPLAKVLYQAGIPTYPDKMFADKFDRLSAFEKFAQLQASDTWVFEFVIHSPAQIKASDESAVDQLQRYFDLQTYYTDHNTSVTISFSPDEVDSIVDMLYENWANFVGVSFMVKDTNHYPLMPYEAITEKEYFARKIDLDSSVLFQQLIELESASMASELLDADCSTGACPVR
jgi:adenosylcobalamin-dependent ribonucleoside-triphosphate reductase